MRKYAVFVKVWMLIILSVISIFFFPISIYNIINMNIMEAIIPYVFFIWGMIVRRILIIHFCEKSVLKMDFEHDNKIIIKTYSKEHVFNVYEVTGFTSDFNYYTCTFLSNNKKFKFYFYKKSKTMKDGFEDCDMKYIKNIPMDI